jgi:hypothetical protein
MFSAPEALTRLKAFACAHLHVHMRLAAHEAGARVFAAGASTSADASMAQPRAAAVPATPARAASADHWYLSLRGAQGGSSTLVLDYTGSAHMQKLLTCSCRLSTTHGH